MAFHTLSIGTSALITARYGLDITGQNLGNVDTPGYSRQRLNQAANKGWSAGLGNSIVGTGVWTQSVVRVGNEYVEKQLRQSVCTDEYYGNMQNCYKNLQSIFNELTGNAVSDSMNKFWNSMNDLSSHVEDLAIRKTTITDAVGMTQRFNRLGEQLDQYRKDVDDEIAGSVTEINRLLNNIADLNEIIVNSELGGASNLVANDLRDQRGEAVKELYEYMDIDVIEEDNGSYIVSLHGRNLVYFNQAKEITNDKTPSYDGTMVNTPVFVSDGYPLTPMSGQLAAQMEMRDTTIRSYKDDVDALAANFIWEFNKIYSQSRGLNSFDSLTSLNPPTDPSVTLDKLAYKDVVPDGTFQITNGNFEIIVHNRNTNESTTVNIEVDLDGRPGPNGEPDTILYDPDNPDADNALINRMQRELDKAVPGAFEVSIDRTNQVTIKSKSSDYGFCFGKDTSGVLAALGLNVFFTGHNATSMGVNPQVQDNPATMGAARSFEKGDNDGLVALLGMRDASLSGLNGLSIEEHYLSVCGRLASEAANATSMKELSCDIYNRMFTQRESLSGVNEDEEVSKMITYQRAFQSAAKFISTVDQMYETLINM